MSHSSGIMKLHCENVAKSSILLIINKYQIYVITKHIIIRYLFGSPLMEYRTMSIAQRGSLFKGSSKIFPCVSRGACIVADRSFTMSENLRWEHS